MGLDWGEDDHGFAEPFVCNWSTDDAVFGSLNGGTGLFALTPAPEEEKRDGT